MTDKKEQVRGKTLFDTDWHKTPNAMIDLVMGAAISPSAGWVVMTVIRYTQGMGGKKSAQIPTEVFKRVLRVKKRQTVYGFVDEAVTSGLINADKKRGCVTTYSVNESCGLWRKEVVPPNGTSTEKGNTSSTEKGNTVVPPNGTPVVPPNGTLIKKDINKDSFKEQNELDAFEKSYEVIKNHLRMGGIIPIGERINDNELRPEAYKFETWFAQKGIDDCSKGRSVITWFSKMTFEERKRYYTFPDEANHNYFNPEDYQKSVPVTDEEAAAIRARYAGVFF